jgi:hypothetical protein
MVLLNYIRVLVKYQNILIDTESVKKRLNIKDGKRKKMLRCHLELD